MSARKVLILFLIALIFLIPLVELSIGFYYVDSVQLCPLQPDTALFLSIGGVFLAIFFAAALGFIYSITPARFKAAKGLTTAQISAKGSSVGMQILIGAIAFIFGACAFIFIVLLNTRVYGNMKKVQWTSPTGSNYCLYAISISAFAMVIANYVAFALLLLVAAILLLGIGL
ncbi:unnamed protein product [Adineta ricciae]|uniref:Uncharacterized protein n=1 Tax=Adineta ricciae TaxID=249248 RepID=A0A814YXW2_ADIRI|nr:unnamed protein product [Adineta ricciae]CAF1614913.1 unnamed protein product [Adineta ricciae]